MFKRLLLIALLPTLTACEYEGAAFLITGRDESLTLVREQPYFWDNEVSQAIVVSRMPTCLRRYSIKPGVAGNVKVEVFEAGNRLWALKQGKNWYLAGTERCELQEWKDAPAEPPGRLAGTFVRKADRLQFVPAEKPPEPIKPAEQ